MASNNRFQPTLVPRAAEAHVSATYHCVEGSMRNFLFYMVDKLWPAFVAVVVTQFVTQRFIEMRKPRLEMVSEGVQPGSWKTFNAGGVLSESPYHMWRITIQHIKIPWYLGWLIKNRESALQCKAVLTFYTSQDQAVFTMQGRWGNSPEISLISPLSQQEKIIYPDTISIGYHASEPLDCIVKFDDEREAYAWNNESYATNGRNPRHKLGIGTYKVSVRLSGQNFQQFRRQFELVLAGDWQGTSLSPP
jgi:hypothetical protein